MHYSRPYVRVRPYRYSNYYGGWGHYGYGYNYGPYGYFTGLRFNLDLVPPKDQRIVKRGIVTVNGAEVGIVNRFDSWQNGSIPVEPGNVEVSVILEDGRVFRTNAEVAPGQVLHVYPRFPPPESQE